MVLIRWVGSEGTLGDLFMGGGVLKKQPHNLNLMFGIMLRILNLHL